MVHSREYDKAAYHFEQALISDMNYLVTYEHYSILLILLKEYEKAEKLIKHAYTLKGINMVVMHYREAILNESRNELTCAKKLMNRAYMCSCNEVERNFLKKELERVKGKLAEIKSKKKRT
jgi:tetratricopeptide (TPR) repeat protein